jgi:hypothetical protein
MMLWKTLALTAAAGLTLAAAPKTPAPKAAAKPAAVKPTAAPVADFDARYPASVVALLNLGGGKAQIVRQEEDSVLVTVNSVAANFTLQFIGCSRRDAAARACSSTRSSSSPARPSPSSTPSTRRR